nr:MAG TPA_asm: hypothetical protein [Caudoviricetes sp.]
MKISQPIQNIQYIPLCEIYSPRMPSGLGYPTFWSTWSIFAHL